jgi:GT2 family glycosyltransferase
VRDRPRQLRRVLQALTRLPDSDYVREVIVVDDASSDRDLTAHCRGWSGATSPTRSVGGAPAARNSGAAATTAPFIAFLDSDCVPEDGWLAEHGAGWLARYEDVRSPLDRGTQSARVLPGGRVPFVPGATLVVRRAALGAGFDETLRGGEDVDYVWRLTEQGWHVRYEPAGRVQHEHRTSPGSWLSRRAYYGRTAAPLARRHHVAARSLAVSPWTAAAWAAAILRRPWPLPPSSAPRAPCSPESSPGQQSNRCGRRCGSPAVGRYGQDCKLPMR